MTEPAVSTIRNYNRRRIKVYFDKYTANELRNLRADLMIAGIDPVSRADQVSITHQVLKHARADALLEADRLAAQGRKITDLSTEHKKLVIKSQHTRNPIKHGVSSDTQVGGEGLSANGK